MSQELEKVKTINRFWDKVEFTTDCWNWIGSKRNGEYGGFGLNGKIVYTHRFSYELYKGKIPEGLVIDHLCKNPACVNPSHLEAVTQQENIKRGLSGKINHWELKKTNCPAGHEYNEENTYFSKKIYGRKCRICDRIRHSSNYKKQLEVTP